MLFFTVGYKPFSGFSPGFEFQKQRISVILVTNLDNWPYYWTFCAGNDKRGGSLEMSLFALLKANF